MRILPWSTLLVPLTPLLLAGCAHEALDARPPSGVDLSGQWKLNVAESDDPMRLTQAALANATAGVGAGGSTQPQGGSGRGQRQGRGGGGYGPGGPIGPAPPSVMMLDEALRWPGRDLTISQSSASVTFTSGGRAESCRPGEHPHQAKPPKDDPRSHDVPTRGRGDAPAPGCGWDEAALVVQPRDVEEKHPAFDSAFSLSDDRQRLVQVVTFHSGRSSGFTASRVWDRVVPGAAVSGAEGAAGAAATPGGAASPGSIPSGAEPTRPPH